MKAAKAITRIVGTVFGVKRKRRTQKKQPGIDELQKVLGHRFSNPSLLLQALAHRSYVDPDDKKRLLSNERLEFLGDAVLNCLVTEYLYKKYPEKTEGQLSKIKSLIVSRKILGELAVGLNLGKYMLVGQSERKGGKIQRVSILSNAFEAVLGAIYLDGGLKASRKFLQAHHHCSIDSFLSDKSNINYKSRILELAQGDGFGIPQYRLLSTTGPDHAKEFTMSIEIGGKALGSGSGTNKKDAQQNAAKAALAVYNKEMILSRSKGDNNELVPDRRTADDH
jgi:ribonuclease-3